MRSAVPRLIPLAVVLLGSTSVLAGCVGAAGSAAAELSATEVAARYGYDVATADLTPVYALVPQFRDPNDGYARDLLARACLQGVTDYPATPPDPGFGLLDERTGEALFDGQIATEWGYSSDRSRPVADGNGPDGATSDLLSADEVQEAMIACGEDADARLGRPPERVLNEIESAGWDASETNAQVAEASAAWRECMAPAGVIDLPEDPRGMPSESVVSQTAAYDDQGAQIDSPTAARTGYVEYAKGTDAVIAELGG
ncbi:MAG: hypothetical protein ACTMIR_01800 [Cellulomonadaceae bacterium]